MSGLRYVSSRATMERGCQIYSGPDGAWTAVANREGHQPLSARFKTLAGAYAFQDAYMGGRYVSRAMEAGEAADRQTLVAREHFNAERAS